VPLGLGGGMNAGGAEGRTGIPTGAGAGACRGAFGACASAGCTAIAATVVANIQDVARVPMGTFNPFILNEYPSDSAILHALRGARQSRGRNSCGSSTPAHSRKPILKRGWLRSR